MLKERKYELVDELAEQLEAADTLIVADYRGLTVAELEKLRATLYQVSTLAIDQLILELDPKGVILTAAKFERHARSPCLRLASTDPPTIIRMQQRVEDFTEKGSAPRIVEFYETFVICFASHGA